MKLQSVWVVSLLSLACSVGVANATTIDFESESTGYVISGSGSHSSSGFTFTGAGPQDYMYMTQPSDPNCSEGGCNSNGTAHNALFADYGGGSPIAMTKTGGGTFSLASLSAAYAFNNDFSPYNALFLTIEADVMGGGLLSQSMSLAHPFATMAFVGWDDLLAVRFIGGGADPGLGNWVAVDNIVVDEQGVPEPTSLALLGLGLVGLGVYRRRS